MWWNVPQAGEAESRQTPARMLAIAATGQRRLRTVLTMLPVAGVEPNPQQPRKHFDEERLVELAVSIQAHGILQPVVVRRRPDGGFQLLAGERRFRAAQLAGLEGVPAIVREGDDPLEIALIENVQREDLAPLEEAEALAALIERHGYSHRELAALLGKSRPYVSNILALTRLPEPIKGELQRDGKALSREVLMGIAREERPEAALALWKRARLDAMSVRTFRAERSGAETGRPPGREVVAAARRLNRSLRRLGDAGPLDGNELQTLRRVLRRTQRLLSEHLQALGDEG